VLGSVFSLDEMSGDKGFLRRQKMWTALWLVLLLSLLAAIITRAYEAQPRQLWIVSAIFSLLCIAGSIYIWHLTMASPLVEEKDKLVFTDIVTLNKFVDEHSRSMAALGRKAVAYIPTGIFIQSLEFSGANDLYVTGYIWQKFIDGIHDKVQRGFRLPEARALEFKEAYRRKTGKTETVGWYFEATIREQFDYSRYPFDRPNIWIWLRPADFLNNVVLIPDLGSYKFLAPQTMPGLQEEVALPGYTFLGSFFDHEYHIRRSDFGIPSRGQMERMPELYYNIVVKRNFITPFVSKLFPLFIMFAILFVVQLMFSQEEEKKKAFGFSALAVMGVIITFFFSTLLSHNSLRQDLGADKIIFIENFHFIAYSILLLVAIKTLLFMGGSRMRLVQYKQGLIPKLLYWPLCTGLVFVISFVSFY
jgi:membrane protein YdbS with pleckstrin-like domain